ncbi:ankyrin repeat domain-containing protein [archaeon]|nr:MAG: ankyrin repeat domain-containing protein [archaeon]
MDLGLLGARDKAAIFAFVEKNGINGICKYTKGRGIDKAMDAMANNKEYFVNLEDDESGGKNMALAEINLWEELMPWLLSHPNLNVAPLTQAEVDAVIGPDTGPLKGVIRLHYRSPLCKAIRGERPELAEQLLAKGASLRELDQVPEYSADFAKTILNTSTEVENALHGAGKVNVVKFLLDKGLKPRRGRLGFCIADLEMLKLVLQALGEDPRRFTVYDAYTDVNTSSTQYVTQRTFLQTAARYGSFESVVYLVEEAGCKQDILKVCADGKTLLGHACDGEREHAAVMTSFKTSFVKLNKPIPATILADKPNQKRWNEVISYLKSFDITKEVDPDAPKFTAQELQELGYSTDLSHFTSSRSSSASDFTAGSVPSTSTPPPAKVDQYGLPVDVYEWESLMLLSYLVKKNIFAKPESLEAADENPILKYSVTGSVASGLI